MFKADVKRLVFKAGVCGVKSVKHKKVTGARISPRSPRSPLDSATCISSKFDHHLNWLQQ